jgi:hypothetical protein
MRAITRFTRIGAALGASLGASMVMTTGCSSEPQSAPADPTSPPSQSAAPTHSTPPDVVDASLPSHRRAVAKAVTALRDYLDEWVSHGSARASRYLVAGQRVSSDDGMPVLVSGTVDSAELYRWDGPSTFTMYVEMHLRFDGDAIVWNRGANARFVTAYRAGQHGRYLLELATGP